MKKISGLFLIDKKQGVTSHDVVDDVRRILGIKEVGHAGTLDPLATGLLICLVGEATKLSQYVMSEDKSYLVDVRFGVTTDSGDLTGQVLTEKEVPALDLDVVKSKIAEIVGTIQLPVPKYSAVKVAGRKLYEYAREKQDVEVPVKPMVIHEARLLDGAGPDVRVQILCEKGTYVRSWVEKLGDLLGVGATVKGLRRLTSGPFDVKDALTIEKLQAEQALMHLIPLVDVLQNWPGLKLQGHNEILVRNGQIPRAIFGQMTSFQTPTGFRLISENGGLLALVTKDQEKGLKLARVFH